MKILSFRIENFRNLRLAECEEVPDFMVICGGNGCGKSALLEALMTAKEHAGGYGNFPFDSRAVSAHALKAEIKMKLTFSKNERLFIKEKFNTDCPEIEEIIIEINRGGSAKAIKRSQAAFQLLTLTSRNWGIY
jgi:AAA15 family ATPase/GTPase